MSEERGARNFTAFAFRTEPLLLRAIILFALLSAIASAASTATANSPLSLVRRQCFLTFVAADAADADSHPLPHSLTLQGREPHDRGAKVFENVFF